MTAGGTNLGGFGFQVGFSVDEAIGNLAALRQAAREAGVDITAALNINLAGQANTQQMVNGLNQVTQAAQQAASAVQNVSAAQPQVNAQQAVSSLNQVAQAAAEVQKAGNFTISINTSTAQNNVNTLSDAMRSLQEEGRTNLVVTATGQQAFTEVARVRTALLALTAGESATIVLRMNDQEALNTLRQLRTSIDAATEAGANVRVNVQSRQAAQDAAREEAASLRGTETVEAARTRIRVQYQQQAAQAEAQAQRQAEADALRATQSIEAARTRIRVQAQQQAAQEQRAAAAAAQKDNTGSVNVGLSTDVGKLGADTDALIAKMRQLSDAANVTIKVNAGSGQKEVDNLRATLNAMGKGDTINLNFGGNLPDAVRNLKAVEAEINAIKAAGGNVNIRFNTAEATSQAQKLAEAVARGGLLGSGIGGGLLLAGGGALGLAGVAIGVQKLTEGLVAAIRAGTQFNSQMQQSTIALASVTGSATLAQEAVAKLKQNADVTPFNTQEVIESGQVFLAVTNGEIDAMLRMVNAAEKLAASRPGKSLNDATVAFREYAGGNYTSLAERFDIPRTDLQKIRDQGGSLDTQFDKVLAKAHATQQQVDELGKSFSGVTSTMTSHLAELAGALDKPLFDHLTKAVAALNESFENSHAQWLEIADQAAKAGGAVGALAESMAKLAGSNTVLEALARTFASIRFQIDATVLALDLVLRAVGLISQQDLAKQAVEVREAAYDTIDPTRHQRGDAQRAAAAAAAGQPAPAPTTGRSASDQALQDTAHTQNQMDDKHREALAAQDVILKNVERQLAQNAIAAAGVQRSYERAIQPLQQQLDLLQAPDFDDQRAQAGFKLAQARINQQSQAAQAPTDVRAEAAGLTVILTHEQQILQIKQRQAAMTKEVADLESTIGDAIKQAQVTAGEQALKRLQEEIKAHQQARQVAIERLRAEADAHKQARDAALTKLRDEITASQQARQDELDGIRQAQQGRQQAAQDAMEAIRARQQTEAQARQDELTGIQETIRVRRDGYQEELAAHQEIERATEAAYQNRIHNEERIHAAQAQSRQDRIDALQEEDRQLQRQESQPTPAERELKALEALRSAQQSAQSLTEAQRAVTLARTGADRRQAIERLNQLREEQAYDKQRADLQAKADQEKQDIQDRQYARQEQIRQATAAAQAADRSYQRAHDAEAETHRQQQEAQQNADRIAAAAEHQQERAEDAQVRAEEQANREADRQAALEIKAAETANREAERRDQAALHAAEVANREADRADQARVRSLEEANKKKDVDDANRVKAAEATDREATRRENAQVQTETDRLQAARDELARQQAARQLAADKQHLTDIQAANAIEAELLQVQLAVLQQTNVTGLAQAAYQQVLLDTAKAIYTNAHDASDAVKAFTIANLAEQIYNLERAMKAALLPLTNARDDAEILRQVTAANVELLKNSAAAAGELATGMANAASAAKELNGTAPGTPGGPEGPPAPGAGQPGAPAPGGPAQAAERAMAEELAAIQAHQQEIAEALEAPWVAFSVDYFNVLYPLLAANADNAVGTFLDAWNAHGDEIVLTLQRPFDDFAGNYFAQTFWPTLASDADNAVGTFNDAWTAHHVETVNVLEAPFIEFQEVYWPAFQLQAQTQGAAAVAAYMAGWVSFDWSAVLIPWINSLLDWLAALCPSFDQVGGNMAVCYYNGWVEFWNSHQLPAPQVEQQGGGGGGQQAPTGKGIPGGGSSRGPGQNTGGNRNLPPGTVISLPPGTVVAPGIDPATGRPFGERFSFTGQRGSFLPDRVASLVGAGAGPGATGQATTINHGPISVHVENYISGDQIGDPATFAQQVTDRTVAAIIDVLDVAQQRSPAPVDRYLPGGR